MSNFDTCKSHVILHLTIKITLSILGRVIFSRRVSITFDELRKADELTDGAFFTQKLHTFVYLFEWFADVQVKMTFRLVFMSRNSLTHIMY